MDIFDNARKHYSEVGKLLGPIEVPEWGEGDEPALIYYRQPTLGQGEEIQRMLEQSDKGFACILQLRALDADGKKVFSSAQIPGIRKFFSGDVVGRVIIEMGTENGMASDEYAMDNEELGNSSAKT